MDQLSELIDRYGIRIDKVLGTVLILAAALAAIFYIDRLLRRLLVRGRFRTHFSYETIVLMMRLIDAVLWVGVALLMLGFWGVSITGLWAVLASIAAVIGVGFLAVWTMVSNITASFFLTIWRPFYMGTNVEILPENLKGRVIDRNMMFTVLRERESGGVLYIPNNLFFQKIFRVSDSNQKHLFEFFEHGDQGAIRKERAINDLITGSRR